MFVYFVVLLVFIFQTWHGEFCCTQGALTIKFYSFLILLYFMSGPGIEGRLESTSARHSIHEGSSDQLCGLKKKRPQAGFVFIEKDKRLSPTVRNIL